MKFIGRTHELKLLRELTFKGGSSSRLTVLYGRRRVGKTRLVEESFKDLPLLKFEGLEGQSTAAQQREFLRCLAEISGKQEYRLIRTTQWTDLLILLADFISDRYKGRPVVVFLDEFQWLAAGRTKLVSSLKYVWDNHLKKMKNLHLILCGSICSFLVNKIIHSRALYGRIDLELHLEPLTLPEITALFHPRRSLREVVELYMAVGGVPQYLERIDPAQSVRLNLERLCFSRGGYLVDEFDRIFVSHFGTNQHFRKILSVLAKKAFASREQLQKACHLASGGRITEYLDDLELAGFIESYRPVDKPEATKIRRFRIADPYLLFYFQFIHPSIRKINRTGSKAFFKNYVPDNRYDVWRGYAFESICIKHSQLISEILGFGAVQFESGSWFSRSSNAEVSQIDLVFLRADKVVTICEIKFRERKIGKGVISEVERKCKAFPNPKGWTIETVLITASPPTKDLANERYFNRILLLEDLFGK